MIDRFRATAPLIYGWAVAAVCAFLGTRFSGDQRITASVWTACAFLTFGITLSYAYIVHARCRREMDAVEQEANADRAALAMGRRARTIYFSVLITRGEVSLYSCPLAQILTDVMPEGGRMDWTYPHSVSLRYTDLGGEDGEPC